MLHKYDNPRNYPNPAEARKRDNVADESKGMACEGINGKLTDCCGERLVAGLYCISLDVRSTNSGFAISISRTHVQKVYFPTLPSLVSEKINFEIQKTNTHFGERSVTLHDRNRFIYLRL
jgi:hypothetical protein